MLKIIYFISKYSKKEKKEAEIINNKIHNLQQEEKNNPEKTKIFFYCEDEYVLYYQHNGIKWLFKDKYQKKFVKLLNEIEYTKTLISSQNSSDKKAVLNIPIYRDIATAICLIFENESTKSFEILKNLHIRLKEILDIKNRTCYLLTCMIFVILSTIPSFFIKNNPNIIFKYLDSDFRLLFYIITCSSLGGFLSISLNIKKIDFDIRAKIYIHLLNAFIRMKVSLISGIIIFLIIRSNLFLGTLNHFEIEYPILVFSIIAGFSERLIPDLLQKIESKNTKEK